MTKRAAIFTIATCIPIVTSTTCMITNPKFHPYIQVKNPEVELCRDFNEYKKHCINVDTILNNNKNFRCFQYALQKTTGFIGEIRFPSLSTRTISISIDDFFEQTKHPQPNGLAVYTSNEHNREIQHFAVIINDVTFESKWGKEKPIWRHRLFDIPPEYGNATWFFTLQEQYTTPEGKKLLVRDIEQAIIKKSNKRKKQKLRNELFSTTTIGIATCGAVIGFIAYHLLYRIK